MRREVEACCRCVWETDSGRLICASLFVYGKPYFCVPSSSSLISLDLLMSLLNPTAVEEEVADKEKCHM